MTIESPTAGPLEAMDAVILSTLRRVRKIEPGTVDAFRIDPQRGALATVQPNRQIEDLDTGHREARAPLPNVPVLYSTIGAFGLRGRLQKGQPVLLLVADSAIAGWLDGETTSKPPPVDAPHSMAGALCIPVQGLGTVGAAQLAQLPASGVRIGSNGSHLDLDDASATLDALIMSLGEGAVSPAMRGTEFKVGMLAFLAAIIADPVFIATSPTVVTAATTLQTLLNLPAGTPTSPFSARVKVS